MKRTRAVLLLEEILNNLTAGQSDFLLRIINEVYIFGSFARGALEPADIDIDIECDRNDEQWNRYFVTKLTRGEDPNTILRVALRGQRRGCQFVYDFRDRADFEMTLLWRRSEPLDVALARLHSIKPDPAAGRAQRDAMMPEFEGIDEWIPRPYREVLVEAVSSGSLRIERLQVRDRLIEDPSLLEYPLSRWNESSPLRRAASAVLGYFELRGVAPEFIHLHGADIVHNATTPYYVDFKLRYFGRIPHYFSMHAGVEYLSVLRPTTKKPLECLRLVLLNKKYFEDRAVRSHWS